MLGEKEARPFSICEQLRDPQSKRRGSLRRVALLPHAPARDGDEGVERRPDDGKYLVRWMERRLLQPAIPQSGSKITRAVASAHPCGCGDGRAKAEKRQRGVGTAHRENRKHCTLLLSVRCAWA